MLLVGPNQQHYGSHILGWNQTLYVGSQYICAYRLVWATAKTRAASYKINLTLNNCIIYTGKSMTRYYQMKNFVLSFHVVSWATPTTIFQPRTNPHHEGNGVTSYTFRMAPFQRFYLLWQYVQSPPNNTDPFITHQTVNPYCFSHRKPDHQWSFDLCVHTMSLPPPV